MSNIVIGREINLEGQFLITANNFAHPMLQRFFNQHNAYLSMLPDGRLKLEYEQYNFVSTLNSHLRSNGVDVEDSRALDWYPETVEADPAVLAMQQQIVALKSALTKIPAEPVVPVIAQGQEVQELPPQQPAVKWAKTPTTTAVAASAPRSSIYSLLRKASKSLSELLKPLGTLFFGSADLNNRYEDLHPKPRVVVPPKVVSRQAAVQPLKEKDKDPFTVRYTKQSTLKPDWITEQQRANDAANKSKVPKLHH